MTTGGAFELCFFSDQTTAPVQSPAEIVVICPCVKAYSQVEDQGLTMGCNPMGQSEACSEACIWVKSQGGHQDSHMSTCAQPDLWDLSTPAWLQEAARR